MDGESSSSKHYKLESILQSQSSEPQNLPLKDLKEITKDFSEEHLLGRGGFGAVYKGVLPNGDIIAVKKLTWTMSGIQDKQYENEARHLMRLKHPNIVQLLGYCSETETELVQHKGKYVRAEKPERLLCLEYLPKGSLCRHLSDESCGLDWNTRYKIIEGICYGLHYLHEEWHSTPIIHRDLTPANILLDDNMVPKIADFGLSRLFSEQQTRTITKNHYGTLGYMSPEYLNRGIITKELDIFSLGVIIIQIITGDKHYPDKVERSSEEFIELVLMNWRNRLEKVPGATSQEFDCQQIRRCIEIGLLCVKLDRAERPTTSKIIEMLASDGAESSNKGVDQMDSPVPDDGSSRGGSPQRGGGPPLKKGPWTSAEDTILVDYVKKHGEGNWNAVQKNTRLFRCGKSCRLRWVNHLRPNLKKGAFSTEEECLIIKLHTMMGNKWVRIAAHLSGRTNNEIKNYWRTRIKRCQRAGLPIIPIYPASVYNQSLNED